MVLVLSQNFCRNPPTLCTGLKPTMEAGRQGNINMENPTPKKPRVLCLHGFRTSAKILEASIRKWPQTVLQKLDLDFLDAPFPSNGKSDVEGIFDPPYFEWYQSSQGYKEYRNFEECVTYLEDYMVNHGPFDGLLGFSQGAILSAVVPGLQSQGVALTRVPKIKFLILISGLKFKGYKYGQPKLAANAFSSPIECPSLHFIGETDFLKRDGIALLESFVDPVVIRHSKGHIVPRLDEHDAAKMIGFIERITIALNGAKLKGQTDDSVKRFLGTKLKSLI